MKTGLEQWRIAMSWGSFQYLDEPRSYYDKERQDVILINPKTGESTKRRYNRKEKEK